MAVKRVGAPKALDLAASKPRRPADSAAEWPSRKEADAPGGVNAATHNEIEASKEARLKASPDSAGPGDRKPVVSPPPTTTPTVSDPAQAKPVQDQTSAAQPESEPSLAPAVDYYAIVSKAIDGLALNNAEMRAEIYERARTVVTQRLKEAGPTMSSHMVAVEQLAFDRAVKNIEADQRAKPPTTPKQVQPAAPKFEALTEATLETPPAHEGFAQNIDQNVAPVLAVPKRQKTNAQLKSVHGGTLRLFLVAAVAVAGLFGYWLATGKPNLLGPRNATQNAASTRTQPPVTSGENISSAASPADSASSDRQTMDAPKPTPASPDAMREPAPAATDTAEASDASISY